MIAIGVTVTRKGTASNAQLDADRLKLDLNDSNKYTNSFTGVLVHIHDSTTCYVVKDEDKSIVIARIGEITVDSLSPTLS